MVGLARSGFKTQTNVGRLLTIMTRTTAARVAGFTFLFYIVVASARWRAPFGARRQNWRRAERVGRDSRADAVRGHPRGATGRRGTRHDLPPRRGRARLGACPDRHHLVAPDAGAATLFAIGSTFFCWLLLRGRMLPRALAWTGVIASVILVAGLPLQLGGLLGAPLTMLMWMPMLAFEVPGGVWLLGKGVPPVALNWARHELPSK